jgi:phosphatidylglycerophosphate synthase
MASRQGKASRGAGVLFCMRPREGANAKDGHDALTSVARHEAVAALHQHALHPVLATAAGEAAIHHRPQGLGDPRGGRSVGRGWHPITAVRTDHAGPAVGLIAQGLLLAALASSVGLGRLGWVVGFTCAVVTNAALAHGISRYRADRLRPADWVTLIRATLAVGVAALVADAFGRRAPVALLVSLAALALALDAVDGWVARRMRTTAPLGAQFDAEVDAFLILTLSVYVSRAAGVWVLAIGAARYAFLAAAWPLPWMRGQLPPRFWRKVVAATQGIVLTIAAADVLPLGVTGAALLAALALLAESFGRDVWWLWRHRRSTSPLLAEPAPHLPLATPARPGGERARTTVAVALTILGVLLVWAALVAPDQPSGLTPSAFLRVPLEGLVLIGLALVLPAIPRRILAGLVGPVLGLVVILKVLDIEFVTFVARPFDPVGDLGNIGTGVETMRSALGETKANVLIVGGVTLAVVVLVATTVALFRLMRVAAGNRRWSLRAATGLGAVWLLCSVSGARLFPHTSIASTSTASFVVHEVRTVQTDIRDSAVFAKQISHDSFRNAPGNQLLTALRGKDVLLVFVESYGQVSVQGSSFSPAIDALLNKGTKQLQTAGFSARSAFLGAPGFGGISWLAHSTLQSGVWVNSQRRYNQLVGTDRFTFTDAFDRAGWRTINFAPADDRDWPEGSSYYHYDKLYDRRDMGYRGPTFTYAPMPDQYMFAALQRLELSTANRRPLFAEVDTVSSHMPWTRIPQQIPWSEVGNGSIFNRIPTYREPDSFWWHPNQVKAAYARSLEYSLSVLISFVQHYGNKNLVLVIVGDEQPLPIVSGQGASHNVPISIIAHDPSVLKRIAGWGWEDGLRPSPQAPVWRMDAFRDRFLTAYGSRPVSR